MRISDWSSDVCSSDLAAHGALHPNRKLNNFLGQWLTGAAVGSDLIAYRTYHLQHHKYTQQPEDPDLSLSKPFPTTRASLWRKVLRDLTGQTFRSEEHTSELQSLMRISYAVFCLKKKKK